MSKKNPHVVEVPVDLSEIDELDRTHRLRGLTDCFGCASVWIGGRVALGTHRRPSAGAVLDGLALSKAAFLAQRLLTAVGARTWVPEPSEESPLVTVDPPD